MATGPDPSRSYPYLPSPYEGGLPQPDEFGDRFAGTSPQTGPFPVLTAPDPPEEPDDTAARLLYPPPGPQPRTAGHPAKATAAALAAVTLLAGLAIAWAAFSRHHLTSGSQLAGRQTTATRQASPAPRARTTPSTARSAPPTAPPTAPGPAPGGGAALVTMAPGVSQAPDAAQVEGFLVSYFTAINSRDYEQYEGLLIPAGRAQLTAAEFAQGYGTTTDSGASIVGISAAGASVAATVMFTSRQRPVPGAGVTSCTSWDITLYLRRLGGTLLIGNPPPAYHAYHRACS
ncbi:MAG: hypothetical protein ACLP5E_23335 [Streptosporangiaceae bacterium]